MVKLKKLQILVGMIASGKSTYAAKLAKQGAIIICDDSIVNAVHGDNYNLYKDNLKVLYKSTELHICSVAIAMNRLVVVDSGHNISVNARKRWIAIAHSLDVSCEAIVFPKRSPEEHADTRNKNGNRGYPFEYWLMVSNTHEKLYTEPSLQEGFDNIQYVTWELLK